MDSNTNSDDRNTCVRRICSSAQSSDDDYDLSDVVVRNPRHSSILLADEGDGSEADLLGTTPPRSRIRNKERRRKTHQSPLQRFKSIAMGWLRTNIETEQFLQKVRVAKRNSDSVIKTEPNGTTGDRFRKRASLKLVRARERDFKQDMSQREQRAEQLPSPGGGVTPAVPTLVESCSRFMSLTSKLKCREDSEACEDLEPVETRRPDQLPPNRVSFHNTFSMLINMGNIDKGCRRTISREEQVWQNELKDLIWLELQAKIAGRTLAQQDAYLCAQRNIVPTVVQNIIDYRFVNTNPCVAQGALGALAGSRDHLDARDDSGQENGIDDEVVVGCLSLNCVRCTAAVGKAMRELTTLLDSYYNAVALYPSCKAMTVDHPLVATQLFKNRIKLGCLSLNCVRCTAAVGKAMRELTTLLDSYYNAVALYPSCKAMTVDHPLVATQLFKNRIKAMCLWYNTALHLRLKMLAVRRMMRTLRRRRPRSSLDSGLSRQSSESTRPSQVRFNMSGSPSASSGSEGAHSDGREGTKDSGRGQSDASDERDERDDEGKGQDEVDFRAVGGDGSDAGDQLTPEIVISSSSSRYGSASSEGGACTEASIGGASEGGANGEGCSVGGADSVGCGSVEGCNVGGVHSVGGGSMGGGSVGGSAGEAEAWRADVYELGPLDDITRLRLLGKCDVSPYREFHVEVLKTQGVRRCMMFVNKMRKNVLHKVHHTLEKPDRDARENFQEEEAAEVFDDTKDEEDKTEPCADDDLTNTYELTRFGCWSEESLAMRLPSYRAHLLALSSICMEAVHDYLELRLETRPDNPSCLTIKQLINELKEGLDISTEMRRDFARSVEVALRDAPAPPAARLELLRLLRAYDATVQAVLKQYLSYLTTMSETEIMGRSCLQQEWAFTARLARRVSCAALLAPITFSDIACNQITVLLNEFKNKFDALVEHKKLDPPDRYSAYSMCRSVQDIYARWREPLLASAQWARALAAKLARARPPAFAPQREAVLNKLMSMRDFIVMHTDMVLERTSVPDEELELTEGLVTRVRVLLLQMFKLGFEIHKEIHRVVNDAGRWGGSARRSVVSSPPRALRHKFARSESIGEDAVFDDKLFETLNNYGENLAMSRIERLLSGCEEPEAAPPRAREGAAGGAAADHEWAARVARAVIEFARCWMRFVVERCDRGRGLRPRWASQGLEFLMLACDPCNTKHLSEEEFEELKQLMDGCISHVVGSRPAPRAEPAAPHAPRSRPRLHSPSPGSPQASPGARDVPPPPTPPNEPEPLLSFHAMEMQPHKKRVLKAIAQLEEERDAKLRALKAVGRVAACAVTSYEPKLRQLTFKWQRGLKIGAGTFGKVYTVVNTESGQLLAMKELGIAAGDRRALQRAANELRVLEGVIHPHLVRYYGCELHKEEMLLFMELCVEGSLEALVATSGALGERTTRRYTKQLLSAVAELHNRNIVHRDIKSGNIFLTNEGHCLKLGDFGCAVKIRANTTAPGELQGFVGTQAYMAPEVFMKSSGHGRAADIWSLGCVVTEMASGKRPFSEYDSNYQIMFVVGMGGRPAEPPLSGEGRAFCRSCLTHDPDARPKADQLSLHSFLMVKSDDNECDCEAAYLRT